MGFLFTIVALFALFFGLEVILRKLFGIKKAYPFIPDAIRGSHILLY